MALPLCNLTGNDNARRACGWHTTHHAVCNTSHVDWSAICSLQQSANWRCCGLSYLDVDGVAFMWITFVVLALVFAWYSNMLREFHTSVGDLHDIPTQALGVVVARQKKQVLGRKIHDPRRVWIILSILIEVGVFSYVPLQLILYDVTTPSPTDVTWGYQVAKFTTFAIVLVVDVCHPRRLDRVFNQVIRPLVYDTGYTTILYAIIDIGACSNDMDLLTFGDGSTCAHAGRYWHFVGVATVALAVFFWRTLLYKMHFSDQVFAVRFRFQTSYYTLMTYCRTACCLFFITIQKFLLYVDDNLVYLAAGVVNFFMFYLLLRYNYKHQPCLGVGKVLNNLRSVAFATSCYFSIYLVALSIFHIVRGTHVSKHVGAAEWIVSWSIVAVSPALSVIVWRVNGRRASLFEIPNMSLEESLAHPHCRVKAVAAVSLTLEDQSKWSVKYKAALVEKLHENLNMSKHDERGMALLYTCQAMWTLWRNYFSMVERVREGGGTCLPFGLWETASRFNGAAQAANVQNKVADILRDKFDSFKPVAGPALNQLVESTMTTALQSNMTMEFWSSTTDPGSDARLRKIVVVLVDLVRSAYSKARFAAAKTLQEMYTTSAAQLTDVTMIYTLCTMASGAEGHVAMPAARTLCKLYALHWKHSDRSMPHFSERLNMLHLSQFVASHGRSLEWTVLMGGVMHVLHDCAKWVESKQGRDDPAVHFGAEFVANLIRAQNHVADKGTVSVYFLVDDIILSIHASCNRYIQRLEAMRTLRTAASMVARKPRILPHEPEAGPTLHPVHTPLRHSWGTVTKLATKAHRLTFLPPAVIDAAQKRCQLRKSTRPALTALVEEGFNDRVAATSLLPQTTRRLVAVMHAWKCHPLVVEEALTHLAENHATYAVEVLNSKLRRDTKARP